jgi:predicted histone-like DNA-binding protein
MVKYTLQELPDEMSDGKRIVFPKMQPYSLHDYETVIRHMHDYAGSFGEGTIRAVFDALVSVMASWMPMGHNIKIDGLGVFSLSLGFDETSPSERAEMEDTDGDPKTKYRHVCIKSINFKPDARLLQALNSVASFERGEDVQEPQKMKLSREERLARAKAIIEKNGYMMLRDYTNATNQSRSAASKDLRQIVDDPNSGITIRGSHSHKVWIAKSEGV